MKLVVIILLAVALLLAVAGVLAGWWLKPLLVFAGSNSDQIQGVTGILQIFLWVGAAIIALWGFSKRKTPAEETSKMPVAEP
ncbi:hypothetical protein L0128_22785, partial [candidate division KSB1 bacterium]|nr:hypothetical protein [candidate division KSB1 bacterium]